MVFSQVSGRLYDGRRYLVDARFGAADLTFATLAAPVLLPVGYRGAYPALAEVSETMRDKVSRLRETPAGTFALRLFAQQGTYPVARNAT